MLIYIYDRFADVISSYNLGPDDAMPYVQNRALKVKEFRGSSDSNILWTSKELLINFNKLRLKWGGPIPVKHAFRRIWEGSHGGQSQHYCGLAMDCAQGMSKTNRDNLRTLAIKMGIFSYVEPKTLTPTWIHIDNRYGIPICGAGYPELKLNDRGNYVMTLQDALLNLGYTSVGRIDGVVGTRTANAVRNYQTNNNLTVTGSTNCPTWNSITSRVVGRGVSPTTEIY